MTHIDMSTLCKAQTNNQNHKLNCTQKWKSKFIWIKNYRRKTIEIKIYWNRNWNQKWDVIAFNINLGSDLHFDVEKGRITKGKCYSDCLVPSLIESLNGVLERGDIKYDV